MKRKLAVTIVLVIMMIFNLCGSAYGQAVAAVAGLSPANSFWNSAKNLIMPVMYRAGPAAGWAAGVFSPANIAMMVGGIMYTVYKEDPVAFPALHSFFDSLGVVVQGGEYKISNEVVVPAAGGWLETCINAFKALPGISGVEMYLGTFESTEAERNVWNAMGFYLAIDEGGTCYTNNHGVYQNCAAWDGEAEVLIDGRWVDNIYNQHPPNGICKYLGVASIGAAYIYGSVPPSQYTKDIFVKTIEHASLVNKVKTALVAGSTSARSAALEIMRWINGQLVGGGTDIDKAGSSTKTIRQIVQTAAEEATGNTVKDAVAADANDTTQGEDVGEDLISAADKIALAEKEAELSQEETPPEEDPGEPEDPIIMPDIPGPSETENEDVIDDTGNDQDIETEQGKVSTILAPLKAIYETLQGTIMTSINNIIPEGSGGVCSLQASVFNGVFNADFCSVDFSALRTLVIAVSALLGLLILLS